MALHEDKTYIGDFYYEKEFIMSEDNLKNKRVFIRFGSTTHNSTTYMNGVELGSHKGGFTPFEYEITNNIKAEENRLLVKINNILDYTTLSVAVYREEVRPDGSIS